MVKQSGARPGILYRCIDQGSPFQFKNVAHGESPEALANALRAAVQERKCQGVEVGAQMTRAGVRVTLDQQLCRWLLLSLDRLQGNELVMTQELIANMLGVRREGVTEGAVKLQKAGFISPGVAPLREWGSPASATVKGA
jgi:hypothetical protein